MKQMRRNELVAMLKTADPMNGNGFFDVNHSVMSQFHQHFMSSFFIRKSFFYLRFGFVIFGANFLYEKHGCKTLMELTTFRHASTLSTF